MFGSLDFKVAIEFLDKIFYLYQLGLRTTLPLLLLYPCFTQSSKGSGVSRVFVFPFEHNDNLGACIVVSPKVAIDFDSTVRQSLTVDELQCFQDDQKEAVFIADHLFPAWLLALTCEDKLSPLVIISLLNKNGVGD